MENVEELVYEGFSEIFIDELKDKFKVKILDLNGGIVSFDIEKATEGWKLGDILKSYVENNNINGIINYFPLKEGDNKYAEIRSQMGKNKISLKIYERKYKVMFENMLNKYLDDRNNFFGDMDIPYLEIGNSSNSTLYEKYEDRVRLILKGNNNGEIIGSEKVFLRELLLYKFSLTGRKAMIMVMSDKKTLNDSYIIYCGNMVVTCPKNNNYAFIKDIVNEYNESLKDGNITVTILKNELSAATSFLFLVVVNFIKTRI